MIETHECKRCLHDGKLDARFLNLVAMGKVPDATEEERKFADTLRLRGLRVLKDELGLSVNYPVLPLVILAPRARVNSGDQRAARRSHNR